MPLFAVLVDQGGTTFLRLPNGEWIKAWPGLTMWQEVAGAEVIDPTNKAGPALMDEESAAVLEAEIQTQKRNRERGVS